MGTDDQKRQGTLEQPIASEKENVRRRTRCSCCLRVNVLIYLVKRAGILALKSAGIALKRADIALEDDGSAWTLLQRGTGEGVD